MHECVVTWTRCCLHSRDCGPGDRSCTLQAREMVEVCGRQRGDGGNEPTPNTDCKGSIPLLKVLCSCILNDFVDNQVEGLPPPPPPPKQFPLPGLLSSSKCRRINLVLNKWHTIVIRLTVAFASMCMMKFHCFIV